MLLTPLRTSPITATTIAARSRVICRGIASSAVVAVTAVLMHYRICWRRTPLQYSISMQASKLLPRSKIMSR